MINNQKVFGVEFFHSVTRAFLMLSEESWHAVDIPVYPRGAQQGQGQGSELDTHVLPLQLWHTVSS